MTAADKIRALIDQAETRYAGVKTEHDIVAIRTLRECLAIVEAEAAEREALIKAGNSMEWLLCFGPQDEQRFKIRKAWREASQRVSRMISAAQEETST